MSDHRHLHDPNTCPNKVIIDKIIGEISGMRTEMHEMDKEVAVNNAVRDTQYNTIIEMLSASTESREILINKVTDLEKKLVVNEHITNQTADAFSRITWGLVGRLGTLFGAAGVVIAWVISIWKG